VEARLQGILQISKKTHLSVSPVKKPSLRPPPRSLLRERDRDAPIPETLYPALKVPGRRALLQVSQTKPLWKRCRSPEPSIYPLGSPAREPSLQVPFTELPQRETPQFQSPFQPYLKVPGRWVHSRLPKWTTIKRDSRPQSLPFITFTAPSKWVHPFQVPLTNSHRQRNAPFPEPL